MGSECIGFWFHNVRKTYTSLACVVSIMYCPANRTRIRLSEGSERFLGKGGNWGCSVEDIVGVVGLIEIKETKIRRKLTDDSPHAPTKKSTQGYK